MKPPIIVYNWGDTGVYPTIEAAERHLEAVDVLEGEYFVFDSEGHILEVAAQGGLVVIRPATPESSFANQLRHVLLHFLRYYKVPESRLSRADLEELVDMAADMNSRRK